MGKFQDLTGKTFGDWKILNLSEKRTGGRVHWDCECTLCGKVVGVSAHNLTLGTSNNCGCISNKKASERFCVDETGNVYGEITVLKRAGANNEEKATWLVKCSCGKEYIISGKRLRNDGITSCPECAYKRGGIKNRINISGNRYNLLTAVECAEENNIMRWRFRCDCGGEIICDKRSVTSGLTKSCGCMISYIENICKDILNKNNVEYTPQKIFKDCVYKGQLRFDFYIKDLNLCMELDGVQHFFPISRFGGEKSFEEQKIRDSIKDKYCLDNNISLLRIPYTQFKNIEQILFENNIIKGETNART